MSELEILREKVDKANREIKIADNKHSGTKSDTKVARERDDNKLEINSVSLEEAKNIGIYEENNKKENYFLTSNPDYCYGKCGTIEQMKVYDRILETKKKIVLDLVNNILD